MKDGANKILEEVHRDWGNQALLPQVDENQGFQYIQYEYETSTIVQL